MMKGVSEELVDLRVMSTDDIYAPDWVTKDAASLKREGDDAFSPLPDISGTSAAQLEQLSDTVSALIFSYLALEEIIHLSLVSKSLRKACRSQELWKDLMTYRWNLKKGDQRITDYYSAYRNAHQNPHDLWITHWNIAFPCDGVAPGRCCIPEEQKPKSRRRKNASNNDNPLKSCPVCRNWSESDKFVKGHSIATIETPGQAMALATCLTRQKCLNPPTRLDGCISSHTATQAFACSGTFHRKVKTDQYKADSTHCLTDLLFFNLTDPCTEAGQWELSQLLREALSDAIDHGIERKPARDPVHETTHHSWYICRLSNPDFYRPIVFQSGIQRPECFTVYPSEGYIEPGESMFLTVGIRPLGSALAYAFDALNVQREGLPAAWADLYTEEAHLPMAPILIRYKYAAVHPSRVDTLHDTRRRQHDDERSQLSDNIENTEVKSGRGSQLEYYWKQPTTVHDVRTIRLSVHVHSHYSFSDFSRATCQPWNWESYNSGPLFNSPQLREHYFDIYSKLDNPTCELNRTDDSLPKYRFGSSHSEEPCLDCGRAWGLREEELAQAYFVHHNDAAQHIEKRRIILRNSLQCLLQMAAGDGIFGKASRHSQLLVAMTNVLHSIKAAPWATTRQKQRALQIEGIVDSTYRQIRVGTAGDWSTWRHAGVYRFALCTDSVFQGPNLETHTVDTEYKDEPDYLDAFRHLAHSPGHYCLGPQEDPNHLSEAVVVSSKRYGRVQKGSATDVFMDNPVFAFQAGICMMRDPRSLLVHGLYDRITYPGTVIRRPRLCCLDSIKPKAIPTISSPHTGLSPLTKVTQSYFALQEYLDLDTIIVLRGLGQANADSDIRCRSLIIYTDEIPPPGVGQFPLSKKLATAPIELSNNPVPLDIDDNKKIVHIPSQRLERNRGAAIARRPVVLANDRGPQIFRLLWILAAQLGLAVIDSPDDASIFVDRNILIASQWVSISLMAAPLFWTLCARFFRLIPSQPINYSLEDLPFQLSNKMRFLTEKECGYFAIVLFIVWLSLGRWTERHVGRDFFRIMLEHVTLDTRKVESMTRAQRLRSRTLEWLQRHWDFCCPLFLQRRVFAPHWNRRSKDDLFKHISFWKSLKLADERNYAQATVRNGTWFDNGQDGLRDIGWNNCSSTKVVVSSIVAMGSFCSSSPHFWLNLVTIFSCSISLGMSISLHSMEKGRPGVDVNSTGSLLKSVNLATVVIWGFLLGQLVGSSGGTLFLAEFVVTSISLILGGAGTISTGAMESWGCFFCLSSTAFWGYLFGRVALMDGVRQKRGGYSSILLSKAVLFLFFFWGLVFCVVNFPSPASLMIVSPQIPAEPRTPQDKLAAKLLQ